MTLILLDSVMASRRLVEDADNYGLTEPLAGRSLEDVVGGKDDLDKTLLSYAALIFSGPEEERIVVAFDFNKIKVGPWFSVWRGQEPVHAFRPIGSIELHNFYAGTPAANQALRDLIRRAQKARRRRYKACVECGERVALERAIQLNGQTMCHRCATTQRGVVF